MIKAAFKVYKENKPQRLIEDTVEREVLNLFKEAYKKELAGTYTELYQMVE